jgi:hypothetical protein
MCNISNQFMKVCELLKREWYDPKVNKYRRWWSISFGVFGIMLVIIFLKRECPVGLCVGFSAFGIGCGLYNSRTDQSERASNLLHYILYFGFVLVIATLAAFVAMGSFKDDTVRSYVAAALTGIAVGFAGDKLAGEIFKVK